DAADRYPTARDMAVAIEQAVRPMSNYEVGEWVQLVAATPLADRAAKMRRMEQCATGEVTSITGTILASGLLSPPSVPTIAARVVDAPEPEPARRGGVLWIASAVLVICLLGTGWVVLRALPPAGAAAAGEAPAAPATAQAPVTPQPLEPASPDPAPTLQADALPSAAPIP